MHQTRPRTQEMHLQCGPLFYACLLSTDASLLSAGPQVHPRANEHCCVISQNTGWVGCRIVVSRSANRSHCDGATVRGRGQQFQGPGFRVFGQSLKKSAQTHAASRAFICYRPVFKMAVTAVPTASASRKGQAWYLQNGLVLDLGPTRRHRFHLPMPASGRFTPSIAPPDFCQFFR